MTKDEFARLLENFSSRPLPATSGRHVYVWVDDLTALLSIASAGAVATLDLYSLAAQLPRKPSAVDEARRVLQRAIRGWLDEGTAGAATQHVIIVTGAPLLARYRASLADFLQAATDSRMFIFVLPPTETAFQPRRSLPAYVQFRPQSNLEFFQAAIDPSSIVGVAGV
jgi:hypothetical protein